MRFQDGRFSVPAPQMPWSIALPVALVGIFVLVGVKSHRRGPKTNGQRAGLTCAASGRSDIKTGSGGPWGEGDDRLLRRPDRIRLGTCGHCDRCSGVDCFGQLPDRAKRGVCRPESRCRYSHIALAGDRDSKNATIPGFLNVSWRGRGLMIRAGGALALFGPDLSTYSHSLASSIERRDPSVEEPSTNLTSFRAIFPDKPFRGSAPTNFIGTAGRSCSLRR